MAVRTLALYQAATALAITTLGAFLATAFCTVAAGADRPTVTTTKPSAWREHQEKAQKYALRRRKRKEKRLRAARAPVVDAAPKRANKTLAAPRKRRSQQTRLDVRRCRSPPRLLSRSLSLVKASRGRGEKSDASFAAHVSSLRPRLASLRDPEHRHQKTLPLSRL